MLAGLIAPERASAQEFIIHANGDSINGDVKGFKRGKLEFEIPGASENDYGTTLAVGWDW